MKTKEQKDADEFNKKMENRISVVTKKQEEETNKLFIQTTESN